MVPRLHLRITYLFIGLYVSSPVCYIKICTALANLLLFQENVLGLCLLSNHHLRNGFLRGEIYNGLNFIRLYDC
jgi:hypothetical protein